jgi:hypothetical protein
MNRRHLLLLPPLGVLAACAASPPPMPEGPGISYTYLPKLRLNVASIDIDETEQVGARPTAGAAPAISAGPAPGDQTPEGTSLGTPPSAGDSDEGGWINAGPPSLELPTTPQHSQEN